MSLDIEMQHFVVSGELDCLSVTCLQTGGGRVGRNGQGVGWVGLSFPRLSPASKWSVFPPPPPLFELLALGQVTKQDSITGR